jgi:stage IV sporulation protein FB
VEADTPGSLRFRLLGFPVAINWSVLFVGALIVTSRLPILAIFLFFPAAIVSILIHELGHALAARRLGGSVESVVLYMMGGLTTWSARASLSPSKRIFISAAGSGTEIIVGAGVFALMKTGVLGDVAVHVMSHPFDNGFWQAGYAEQYIAYTAGAFVWVSVMWGVLNWLPIGGFDGSHMLREFMVMRNPQRGYDIARNISIVASIALFLYLYSTGNRMLAFFIAIIAISNLANTRRY